MANISKEDDDRDFEERRRNNWNRLGDRPRYISQEEQIRQSEEEVKANMAKLRLLRKLYEKKS